MNAYQVVEKAMKDGYCSVRTFGGDVSLHFWAEITTLKNVTYENGRIVTEWLPSILEPGKLERLNFELTKKAVTAFDFLKSRYGASAATTYDYNRECGQPARVAYSRMMAQVKELGCLYQGGLECTKYRKQA